VTLGAFVSLVALTTCSAAVVLGREALISGAWIVLAASGAGCLVTVALALNLAMHTRAERLLRGAQPTRWSDVAPRHLRALLTSASIGVIATAATILALL
jgi:hypothetical protein